MKCSVSDEFCRPCLFWTIFVYFYDEEDVCVAPYSVHNSHCVIFGLKLGGLYSSSLIVTQSVKIRLVIPEADVQISELSIFTPCARTVHIIDFL